MAVTFGAVLRRHRIASGISQNDLAGAAQVDPAYVNRLERAGQRTISGRVVTGWSPSRHVVLALAEALGLGPAETDRFLFAAGLATQTDWQARAERAEYRLELVRKALAEDADVPRLIRRSTG